LETILSTSNLSKHFGKIHAVNSLSIEVTKGQVFGLLGPNGSGKTTSLGILLDLVKADSGTFQWFGERPTKKSRKRIGAVIETPNFFPYLTAKQNLEIVAKIKDIEYRDIDRVLTLAGLYERRNSRFRTFSFGMKQRLAVASALLGMPEVMILDEPTNGLDPQGIAQIRNIILQVSQEGITIILASHLLDEVQKICSHVTVLNKGGELFSGKVSEVLAISDSFEMSAGSMDDLEAAISTHPEFKSLTGHNNRLLVYFSGIVPPGDINRFLYEKGVILDHLTERKRTLEQHFLELLQDNPS
jgi:ABC-2 type transport system ATP-binding protein